VSLSAFFTWAARELRIPNPMPGVPAPRFAKALVQPFTREETHAPARSAGVEQLLKAAESCHEAQTTRRRRFAVSHRRAAGSAARTV
jgi:hypothetical protein